MGTITMATIHNILTCILIKVQLKANKIRAMGSELLVTPETLEAIFMADT